MSVYILALFAHPWAKAVLWLVIGLPLIRLLASLSASRLSAAGSAHHGLVARRVITTAGGLAIAIGVARALGLDLTAVLATAGVLTVAIGFAAQTSLSNLIAGLFLLVDRPFQVGDIVEIEGRIGVIESITLLSTHVRTFENLRVRWPNEVVLKATIVNYTRYPVRRIDLRVRLVHGSNLTAAVTATREAVAALDLILLDPPVEVVLRGYVDGAVEVEVRAWMEAREVQSGRSAMVRAVHDALVASGVTVQSPLVAVPRAG